MRQVVSSGNVVSENPREKAFFREAALGVSLITNDFLDDLSRRFERRFGKGITREAIRELLSPPPTAQNGQNGQNGRLGKKRVKTKNHSDPVRRARYRIR